MFLTKEDLTNLTGAKKLTNQVNWLRDQGIKYLVNAAGHPVVAIKHVEEILCNGVKQEKSKDINESALMQVMNATKKKK